VPDIPAVALTRREHHGGQVGMFGNFDFALPHAHRLDQHHLAPHKTHHPHDPFGAERQTAEPPA
jgi:hypothetical protein